MYSTFLSIHSIFRWIVLLCLLYTFFTHIEGLLSKRSYSKTDNIVRNMAKGFTELQLLIGFVLYFLLSPTMQYFFKNGANGSDEALFFEIYHIAMMFVAVAVMSIGNGMVKKAATYHEKFKQTIAFFGIALLLILLAIPWFRPFLRGF